MEVLMRISSISLDGFDHGITPFSVTGIGFEELFPNDLISFFFQISELLSCSHTHTYIYILHCYIYNTDMTYGEGEGDIYQIGIL